MDKNDPQKNRILIVDDIPENIKVVGTILFEMGYELTIANSGEEALEVIESAAPDLILLDVMMPGISGYETCRRLKKTPATAEIPVIFMSARSESVDVVEGFKSGGVDYIVKPFEQEVLLARIATHLTIRNLEQELRKKLNTKTGALEESKKLYKEIVETSYDVFWELDLEGYYTYLSPRCEELFGYKAEELLGKHFSDILADFDKDRIVSFYDELLKTENSFYSLENTISHRNGEEKVVETSARPVYDKNNKLTGYRGVDRDITQRKEAEKEASKTKTFLQNIIESMPSALLTIDNFCKITMINRSAADLIGLTNEQAIGQDLIKLLPYLSRYSHTIERIKREKKRFDFHFEEFQELKNSYYDISFYPLITNGIEGIVIRIDDVTDLEKIESQLVQSQKMETLGIMAGGLAHDFNNVLAGIITTTSLIEYDMEQFNLNKDEFNEYIKTIAESGKRAADIVKQLLALSRKNKLNIVTIDLTTPINNVLKICRNSFDKSITIKSQLPPEKALVKADLTQMEQIILNLAINAYHAMTIMRKSEKETGGTLTIGLEKFYADSSFCKIHLEAKQGHYYTVKIVDTGVGIEREDQKKIFEPFYTTKKSERGTGLGLSMVYNLVNQHKGFITVYSEVGVGTTFTIYLPEYNETPKEESPLSTKELKAIRGTGKVLVIDDEETVRALASTILVKGGYSTILAANGREGVEIYRERHSEIDLILLDISMPELSGQETFRELIKITPDVKVVITSGFEQDSRINELKSEGIKAFIQKPYNFIDLIKLIGRVINA